MDSLGFLSDRMFKVMDEKNAGRIEISQYLNYFDVMLHGTEDEKMQQSFHLLDIHRTNKINYEDFKNITQSFAQMWSAALGYPIPLNRSYIQNIFQKFAGEKKHFNYEDYKLRMQREPDILVWFSKPEEAMNKRLNKRIDKTLVTKQHMLDQINLLKDTTNKYVDEIGEKLSQCLEVFT